MCLTHFGKKKTAILPLIAFKETSSYYRGNSLCFITSFQKDFTYLVNEETPHIEFKFNPAGVTEGYHSSKYMAALNENYFPGIFIIPRGATYYSGKNNGETYGRCASSMIYVGPLTFKNYLKAIWMKLTLVTTKYKVAVSNEI